MSKPGTPPAGAADPTAVLFAEALEQHRRGDLPRADATYQAVLARAPDHIGSLHHLGVLAIQTGRPELAVTLIERAIGQDSTIPEAHFHVGMAFGMLGRFDKAAEHNRNAIALRPDYAQAHMNLGNALKAQGMAADAIDSYRRALALAPDAHELHYNIANALADAKRLDEAATHYQKALVLNPDYADAHNNFGTLCTALGRSNEAVAHHRRAVELNPQLLPAIINLAEVLRQSGDLGSALDAAKRANDLSDDNRTRHLLFQCLADPRAILHAAGYRDKLIRALSEPWGDPRELAGPALTLLYSDPVFGEAVRRATIAWPTRLSMEQLFEAGAFDMAQNPLLQFVLVTVRPTTMELERMLTSLRVALLDAGDDETLALHCALARQCFLNEYVFVTSIEEEGIVEPLRQRIADDLQSGAAIPPSAIAAVASYGPLHEFVAADALLARSWPAPLAAVLTQQVGEPRAAFGCVAAVPRLTEIDDKVSLQVQRQYEASPYPRWEGFASLEPRKTLPEFLRAQFPLAPIRLGDGPEGLDYLIAGCGTGRHAAAVALAFSGLRLMAIDLSRASLGYAMRATDGMGLTGIDFGQADILKLGSLGRSFDVIDASGVLHHMTDPAAALAILRTMLRPNGCMRLGLYSEIARRSVVAARELIAHGRYGQSADEIRRCRQDLFALADGEPAKEVTRFWDFYSLSECRDLLFHVQEHRLTLPQIEHLLSENGLDLIGFEVEPSTLGRYRERFPQDKAATDLSCWHVFEQDNPATFGAMYQFWVQPKAAP